MRLSPRASVPRSLCFLIPSALALGATSLLPVLHLDSATIKVFQDYVSQFESSDVAAFRSAGRLWIDGQSSAKKALLETGKPVIEPRENRDAGAGSIHHFTGMIHVPGGTIDAVRRIMQDYPHYPKYFPPDVTESGAELMPDSTPADEHFHSHLTLVESTLWINVAYQTTYDTHYLRPDPNHWDSRSVSLSIRELLDPANPARGTFPEGEDHGFLWKTNTYWFARQRPDGLDLEANSITLSRPNPIGFSWWATKRTREAVDKMLRDVKRAMESSK